MGNITGSPKNFESAADKAGRIAMSRTDGTAALPHKRSFQEGGEVEAKGPTPILPNPFSELGGGGKGGRKPKPRPPTPLPANELRRGGRAHRDDGGEVEARGQGPTPILPNPFSELGGGGKGGRKPKPRPPTPLPPNELKRGGHSDEKADRKLFNKMFREKRGK
jgi:hypothetical protein